MNSPVDRGFRWSHQKYIELVENTRHPIMAEYEKVEAEYLKSNINSPKTKSFIDVGAGYGRVLPLLASLSKNVIAVEIDKDMLDELQRRAEKYPNVEVIEGDGNYLSRLLKNKSLKTPVILSLQNTLGPWVGDWREGLREMRRIAEPSSGEIVISVHSQEALRTYGIDLYRNISGLVGEPDLEKTDFDAGIFISKTGYRSQWWTRQQREEIATILRGNKVGEIAGKPYYLLHVSYK